MGALPVDRADDQSQVDVGFVAGDRERAKSQRTRNPLVLIALIQDGPSAPVVAVSVNRDGRVPSTRAHRDDAIVLLSVERIEPEAVALDGNLEIDDGPVLLEPFVYQGEQSGARGACLVDLARQPGVDLGLFLLGVSTVAPSLRLDMRDSPR